MHSGAEEHVRYVGEPGCSEEHVPESGSAVPVTATSETVWKGGAACGCWGRNRETWG